MTLQRITGLAAAATIAVGSLAMPATGLASGHARHHHHGHAVRHTHRAHHGRHMHHGRRVHRLHHSHHAVMAHIALVGGMR